MPITFPTIDPILIQLGPLAIRWYSLAYIAGVMIGWWVVARELAARPLENLTKPRIDDLVIWAIAGIILGGRLGYVLFYKFEYYIDNPAQILHVWEGGMSFHGGFIGFALAFLFFCRRHKVPYLNLMDLMACVAPIGLGLGRIANFINGELWGRVTTSPLGMIFPTGGDLPRHPSQLYEAALEGLVLFIVMMWLLKRTKLREKSGALCGMFLIGYGFARIFCEFFREPDAQLGFLFAGATMGQLLCIPMVMGGVYLLLRKKA